ncbi:hypothetical protein CVT24_007601 [Panaeolus cyanescens]|uniref:Uncharacterized protein n=1 Tax=Panaeolus cyanescens TaxID=181874 RepID=A0A409YLU2_9AGAR|nr:hypothetical protein CVT24_007601 [Panaeolus cyanescens]
MSSEVPPSMNTIPDLSTTQSNTVTPTNPNVLSTAEIATIIELRADLISKSTDRERLVVIKQMLHRLRIHWRETNRQWDSSHARKEATRVAARWISNTWRRKKQKASKLLRVNIQEYVWTTRQEAVWKVISKLLDVENANTSTPGWMKVRQKAITNVRERFTPEEAAQVRAETERAMTEGFKPEIQARLAEKSIVSRVELSHKQQYLEMGALSIQISVHRNTLGKIVVITHDHSTSILGLQKRTFSFSHTQRNLLEEVRTQLVSHCMGLWRLKNEWTAAPQIPVFHPPGTRRIETEEGVMLKVTVGGDLERTSSGFPLLPADFSGPNIKPYRKADLEVIYKSYTNIHYNLATGGKCNSVPWSTISSDLRSYIAREHLPDVPDLELSDYRSTKSGTIVSFLRHVAERQVLHGAEQAFRFRKIVSDVMVDGVREKRPAPALYGKTPTAKPKAKKSTARLRATRNQAQQSSNDSQHSSGTVTSQDANERRDPKSKEILTNTDTETDGELNNDTFRPPSSAIPANLSTPIDHSVEPQTMFPTPDGTPAPDPTPQPQRAVSKKSKKTQVSRAIAQTSRSSRKLRSQTQNDPAPANRTRSKILKKK